MANTILAETGVARARVASSAGFFLMGTCYGLWFVHIPVVTARLGLEPGILGLALLGAGLGAVIAQPVSGWIVSRVGSRLTTTAMLPALIIAFTLPILAPTVPLAFPRYSAPRSGGRRAERRDQHPRHRNRGDARQADALVVPRILQPRHSGGVADLHSARASGPGQRVGRGDRGRDHAGAGGNRVLRISARPGAGIKRKKARIIRAADGRHHRHRAADVHRQRA